MKEKQFYHADYYFSFELDGSIYSLDIFLSS